MNTMSLSSAATQTHFRRVGGSPDVLEILFIKDVPHRIDVTAVSDLSSDHDIFVITIRLSSPHLVYPIFNARIVNWRLYLDELARTLPSFPTDPIVTRYNVVLRA